jgi:trans-2-enoyl-CoA reductase
MTTETKRITHTILEGNITTGEGASSATREDVERLAQSVADRIAAAFPGYEVAVPIAWRTSGSLPSQTRTTDEDRAEEIKERVNELAGEAWQAWCESLPEKE